MSSLLASGHWYSSYTFWTAAGAVGAFFSAAAAAVGVWRLFVQQSRNQITRLGVWGEKIVSNASSTYTFTLHIDNRSTGPVRGARIFANVSTQTQIVPVFFDVPTVPAKEHFTRTVTIITDEVDSAGIDYDIVAYLARDNFGRRWYIKRESERGQTPKRLILSKTGDYGSNFEELSEGGSLEREGLKITLATPSKP